MHPDVGGNNLQPDERRQLIEKLSYSFSPAGVLKRRRNRALQNVAWLIWVQIVTGSKRLLDFLIASALLVALAPLLAVLYVAAQSRGGGIARAEKLGRWGCVYRQFAFSHGPFRNLPAVMNVWIGDMSLIGPRAVSPSEIPAADQAAWRRFNIRPGFICLWWIRKRANIGFASEFSTDMEYVDTHSIWGDVGLGLRAIPAAFFGEGIALAPERIEFLGIPVDNLTMEEAIDAIAARAGKGAPCQVAFGSPCQVAFVNADCVNISYRDAAYRRIVRESALVFADGIGVKLAGRLLNANIRQNVNGTDVFPRLCARMEQDRLGLYLLGGRPGVAEGVAQWVAAHYPALEVCGHRHGYFSPEETSSVAAEIRDSGAAVLLVAFGVPRQEQWISQHLAELGIPVSIGVGGLFDFYSGRIRRAPQWVREIGMEWFYRFLQEPGRMWRRYFLGNFIFLCRVIRYRLSGGASGGARA
jgi:N-acetylglucosaminyldiphosphoundecaprenol N-acetyl-beta-D-mannosaminyltransferase